MYLTIANSRALVVNSYNVLDHSVLREHLLLLIGGDTRPARRALQSLWWGILHRHVTSCHRQAANRNT